MDGDGTPAVTMVHDDAVDGFGQAARVAPRQGCKNGGGIEKVRAFQHVNCTYIIHQMYITSTMSSEAYKCTPTYIFESSIKLELAMNAETLHDNLC